MPFQRRTPEKAEKVAAIRARIERCKAFPEEGEVLSVIFSKNPELEAGDLRMMRKDCDARGVVFLEYQHDPYPYTSYIYVNERCQNPDYLGMGRKKIAFDHPGGSVLLKTGPSGTLTEVHRWETKKKES